MIWDTRQLDRKTEWVARQGTHNYRIYQEGLRFFLSHWISGDGKEILGMYITEAHAKDAAEDHQEARNKVRRAKARK